MSNVTQDPYIVEIQPGKGYERFYNNPGVFFVFQDILPMHTPMPMGINTASQ
jgi:hypothetical protein